MDHAPAPRLAADTPTPRVIFTYGAWQRINLFIGSCALEINGFGLVERIGNDFTVTDAFITEQVVTGGSAVVSGAVRARTIGELIGRQGHADNLRLQWHSHVSMSAYFSATDLAAIDSYTSDYMVSLVGNKRGEFECRLDVYLPVRFGLVVTPLVAMPPADAAVAQECARQITERVKRDRPFRLPPTGVKPTDEPGAHVLVPASELAPITPGEPS